MERASKVDGQRETPWAEQGEGLGRALGRIRSFLISLLGRALRRDHELEDERER